MRVTIRMWTKEEYHKDVAIISEKQVHMSYQGMNAKLRHVVHPVDAVRVVVDQKQFPEAVEFEVIVQR